MPVTDVRQDLDTMTLTITAEFDAPVARIWQVYADPRQLEQGWGPPTYPATVVDHDLTPGGRVTYYMTSPEGEKHAGYWNVTAVDEPVSLSFEAGFADMEFTPSPGIPVSRKVFSFTEIEGGGTRATYVHTYQSVEAMQQALEMGMIEGFTLATNQIDGLLAA